MLMRVPLFLILFFLLNIVFIPVLGLDMFVLCVNRMGGKTAREER